MEQTTYTDRLLWALGQAGLPCDTEEALNRSSKALAKKLGVSYQGAVKVLQGKTKHLRADNHAKVAQWLNVNAFWLATGTGPRLPTETGVAWPFERLAPSDFATLDAYERHAVEEAAAAKLTELMQRRGSSGSAPPPRRRP
jgi:hypothetical protein